VNEMPKAPTGAEIDLAARIAEREQFECVDFWRRSRNGNLWREYGEMRLTVFKRAGGFAWVGVDSDDEKRWSEKTFEQEEFAMADLADFLGVGR
jgi:hypothetical protein